MDRRITEEELQRNDGRDGRPAWVARNGKVYDVSGSRLWSGGMHQRRHQAGKELTADFAAAPHDEGVLQRVPMVGQLATAETGKLHPLLAFYLDLHAHPIAVHFPTALTVAAAGFLVLYLLTDIVGLVDSAYYALLSGVAMSPVAIAAGVTSWWFNYGHRLTGVFRGKAVLAAALLAVGIAAAVLWATNRDALVERQSVGWVYFALVMVMVGLVASLGKLGGELVFPSRRR